VISAFKTIETGQVFSAASAAAFLTEIVRLLAHASAEAASA